MRPLTVTADITSCMQCPHHRINPISDTTASIVCALHLTSPITIISSITLIEMIKLDKIPNECPLVILDDPWRGILWDEDGKTIPSVTYKPPTMEK